MFIPVPRWTDISGGVFVTDECVVGQKDALFTKFMSAY